MRITNNMLVNNMLTHITNNQQRMDKIQQMIATGKKIVVPSDDPIVASRSLSLRTSIAEIEQHKRNNSDALSWLETTDVSLGNIENVLQRARELTVQGTNGVLATDEMVKIAEEIKQLKSQAIHLGNTTYAGRYIFSGFKTDRKLLNDDPNSDQYGSFNMNINTTREKIKFEISIGDVAVINVPGGDLFNYGSDVTPQESTTIGNTAVTFPLTVTSGANDTLNLNVDGENISITIDPATYNEADLMTALKTKINSATTKVDDIDVEAVGGKIKFTCGKADPASMVLVTGGNAVNDLGINSTSLTKGVNDGNAVGDENGALIGGESVTSLVIDATNNVLDINVDGASISVTIDSATYPSYEALAEEIQEKINSDPAVTTPMSVAALGKKLTFTSGKTGPNSYVIVEGGNSVENLGLSVTTSYVGTSAQKGRLINDFDRLISALESGDNKLVGQMLQSFDENISNVLRIRADIGARQNRIEMTLSRKENDYVAFTKLMSDNEDVDMAETIMKLKSEENVYQASLAGGARIIQPTLMDFLR